MLGQKAYLNNFKGLKLFVHISYICSVTNVQLG